LFNFPTLSILVIFQCKGIYIFQLNFHMTNFIKIFLSVLELFHVSSGRDGRKEEIYRLFAGIKAHLKRFWYKISDNVYGSEKNLCVAEVQSSLKCHFNYKPWFTITTIIIFCILQNFKTSKSHIISIYQEKPTNALKKYFKSTH
jgi:hypothetical protein